MTVEEKKQHKEKKKKYKRGYIYLLVIFVLIFSIGMVFYIIFALLGLKSAWLETDGTIITTLGAGALASLFFQKKIKSKIKKRRDQYEKYCFVSIIICIIIAALFSVLKCGVVGYIIKYVFIALCGVAINIFIAIEDTLLDDFDKSIKKK